MKKKILFVTDVFLGGGAERVLTTILNNIDKSKYEPILLILYNRIDEAYLKNVCNEVSVIKGPLNQVPLKKRLLFKINSFQFLPFFFKSLIKLKPDIVFCNKFITNAIASLAIPFFRKTKWIARETTSDVNGTIKTRPIRFLYRTFYLRYDVVIAQCEEMKQAYIDSFRIPEDKFEVIYNPIDTNYIDKNLKEVSKKTLPSSKINILASGRLVPSKGFDSLLKNFAQVKNKHKYHLTILGEADDNEKEFFIQLKEFVKLYNLQQIVSFEGFKTNVHKWLAQADVFILSSKYEGFPNMLLEALYVGIPAIANRCPGGITEIIEEGVNGFTFNINSDSLDEYLKKIEQTIFDKSLIKQITRRRFGIESQIKKFERLFN